MAPCPRPRGGIPFWISPFFETLRAVPSAHLTEWAERLGWRPLPPALQGRWTTVREVVRPGSLLGGSWRAFHDAVRSLRRSPRFTGTATLLFAIGIGANTLVFCV